MCDRCAQLEEENRYLRRQLGMMADEAQVVRISKAFHVHPGVARMISSLYGANGRSVRMDTLMSAVPPKDPTADPMDRETNNVRIWVMRARKAMGDGCIATANGIGYSLTAAGMERVAVVLK